MSPVIRSFVQRCFAVALMESFELKVKPENIVVIPKGKNGEYDCHANDEKISIAAGTFYGYASSGAVCITKIYDREKGYSSLLDTRKEYSTHMLGQPTGWPAVDDQ